jgi:hypothetical protein
MGKWYDRENWDTNWGVEARYVFLPRAKIGKDFCPMCFLPYAECRKELADPAEGFK